MHVSMGNKYVFGMAFSLGIVGDLPVIIMTAAVGDPCLRCTCIENIVHFPLGIREQS